MAILPYQLTIQQPELHLVLPFLTDSFQIVNVTPHPVYVRVGDTQPANASNAHYTVFGGMTLALSARTDRYSLFYDVGLVGDAVSPLASVQILFMVNEQTVPYQSSILPVVEGTKQQIPTLQTGMGYGFILDARGYEYTAFSFDWAGNADIQLFIGVSKDGSFFNTWSVQHIVSLAGDPVRTIYVPNLYRYVSLTIGNLALADLQGASFLYNRLHTMPAVGSAGLPFTQDADGLLNVKVIGGGGGGGGDASAANQTTQIALATALNQALSSVGLDQLRVDVQSSALPAGAATLAEQQSQTALLGNMDPNVASTAANLALLVQALSSIATDALVIDGRNSYSNIQAGYWASYSSTQSDLNPGAGTIQKDLTATSAGQLWYVQSAWCYNATRGERSTIWLNTGQLHPLSQYKQPDTSTWHMINGLWLVPAGWKMSFTFYNVVAGDDLYWGVTGYKARLTP